MPRPLRRLLLATGVLLLVAPGAARAQIEPATDARVTPHQHDLNFDKQEIFKEVPAGGAVKTFTATCGTDFFVLSGAIRVDTVPGGQLTDVELRRSVPTGDPGPSSWTFEVLNRAPSSSQAAQIKLMIACVKKKTSGGSGDQHDLSFRPRIESPLSVPSFAPASLTKTVQCDSSGQPFGSIPVGGGTTITPDTEVRRLVGFSPSIGLYNGAYFPAAEQNWVAGSDAQQVQMTLTATLYCLSHYLGLANPYSHSHYLDTTLQTTEITVSKSTSSSPFNQAVFCPNTQYAVAPTFSIPFAAVRKGLRLVGIGYQGDQDVFRFVNPNTATEKVKVGVLCLGKKSSSTTKPTAGAGPGAQKLLTSERTVRVRIPARSTRSTTVGCATKTDYVVAGTFTATAAVATVRSGGGDPAKWPFTLRNAGNLPVGVALHVKCLSPWAEGHTLFLQGTADPDGTPGCGADGIAVRPSVVGGVRSVRCLNRRTTQKINHVHTLGATRITAALRGPGSRAVRCPAGSSALVGTATLTAGQRVTDSAPAGRAWRFAVTGNGRAALQVTCVKDGTTPETAAPILEPQVPPQG